MPADALSFIPEDLHADILAGISTVDVSGYLNNGLNTAKIIELPQTGQMSVASSLVVPSGGGIIGVNFGCTIKALPNFGNIPLVRNATMSPATEAARDRNILLSGIRLDGNKANNGTATEFGHGVQLLAVDGARLDVQIINPKGDGVSIQQGSGVQDVGCCNIFGKVRTMNCSRQGVTITCGEQVDLDIYDTGTSKMSVDLEPDFPMNFIRNIFLRVLSSGTGDGNDISGGVCVAGDGLGCSPTNVTADFGVYNSGGQGAIWRDAMGLILCGTITNPALNGLVGIHGGASPSRVFFDSVRVFSAGAQGLTAREVPGSAYDGRVSIEDSAGGGAQIESAAGGTLGLTVKNSGQQGLLLHNTGNMTFASPIIEHSGSHNVWLSGGSTGNRFQFLKSTSSSFGWGVLEAAGSNNNMVFMSRVTGNGAGNVSLSGAQSSVQPE